MLLWTAVFKNGHTINQPEDDRYSKHDDTQSWNPSSFRDIQDYENIEPLEVFRLGEFMVNLRTGIFSVNSLDFTLEDEPLTNRKLIYYRVMESDWLGATMSEPRLIQYAIGYEGKNNKGKVEKKVMRIAS